jgi:hypothetical protein
MLFATPVIAQRFLRFRAAVLTISHAPLNARAVSAKSAACADRLRLINKQTVVIVLFAGHLTYTR